MLRSAVRPRVVGQTRSVARETTIRVDTARAGSGAQPSGEIGLTKNRLTSLRADILAGRTDTETLPLDQAVGGQLDLLVSGFCRIP